MFEMTKLNFNLIIYRTVEISQRSKKSDRISISLDETEVHNGVKDSNGQYTEAAETVENLLNKNQ